MSDILLTYILPIGSATVAIILLIGLWTFLRANANKSQQFMRFRVIAQALVLVIAMTILYLSGQQP